MNLTIPILEVVATQLRNESYDFQLGSVEADTLMDAADALDDAVDLLKELELNG